MRIIIICIISIFLLGCENSEKEDFVGIWKAKDGASIKIYSNGEFTANRINYYNVFSDKQFINKHLDFSGKWTIVKEQMHKIIMLHSNSTYKDYGIDRTYIINGVPKSHKLSLSLNISGKSFFEKDKASLFIWIGDPDNMNKYIFVKQ